MLLPIIGALGGIIFLAGDLPYFIDTLKGKTKPQRVTWGVFFALNAIGFANQYASGATNSLLFIGATVLATGAIFAASIKNGVGGYGKLDVAIIITSILGVILWAVFKSPLYSILANVSIGAVALVPTFLKAKTNPESETRIAWLCATLAAVLGALSVGKLDFKLLVAPVTFAILQGYLVYLLYIRPKKRIKE